MRKKIQISFTCFFLIVLWPFCSAYADWVDNWMGDMVTASSGPSQIEVQGKQYYSGGAFAARKPFKPSYNLASVTLPKVSIGCGGIDIKGGTAMLNFDYVIDSMERIAANAPALAFNVALTALSESMADQIQWLKDMQNFLNSVQINECKASKTIAAVITKPFLADKDKQSKELVMNDFLDGDFESWNDGKFSLANNGQPTPTQNEKLNSGCGGASTVINAFVTGDVTYAGSVLEYIMTEMNIVPLDSTGAPVTTDKQFIKVVRGLVGDLVIEKEATSKEVGLIRIPTCSTLEETGIIDGIISGQIQARDKGKSTNCAAYTGSTNIVTYLQDKVTSVYGKMIAATPEALSANEQVFLEKIPTPLYDYMRQLYAANIQSVAGSPFVDTAARGFAYSFIKGVLGEVDKVIDRFDAELEKCGTLSDAVTRCSFCSKSSVPEKIKEWREGSNKVMASLEAEWLESQEEIIRSMMVSNQIREALQKQKNKIIN